MRNMYVQLYSLWEIPDKRVSNACMQSVVKCLLLGNSIIVSYPSSNEETQTIIGPDRLFHDYRINEILLLRNSTQYIPAVNLCVMRIVRMRLMDNYKGCTAIHSLPTIFVVSYYRIQFDYNHCRGKRTDG